MTIDKQKLKEVAEALLRDEQGAVFTEEEAAAFPQSVHDFDSMTSPSAVLALLAEIEQLQRIHMRYSDSACRLGELLNVPEDDQCMPEVEAAVSCVVAERDQLKAENEQLRKVLGEISGQVDGNIRCTVRDVVNGLPDVQDIYGYCDAIDEIIDAAMAREVSR